MTSIIPLSELDPYLENAKSGESIKFQFEAEVLEIHSKISANNNPYYQIILGDRQGCKRLFFSFRTKIYPLPTSVSLGGDDTEETGFGISKKYLFEATMTKSTSYSSSITMFLDLAKEIDDFSGLSNPRGQSATETYCQRVISSKFVLKEVYFDPDTSYKRLLLTKHDCPDPKAYYLTVWANNFSEGVWEQLDTYKGYLLSLDNVKLSSRNTSYNLALIRGISNLSLTAEL